MKIFIKNTLLALFFCSASFSFGQNRIVTLENSQKVQLSIDLLGGAFIDFRITDKSVNPFSWNIPQKDMPINNRDGASFQGHFLCLGRWGAPSEGEMRAGVPHNGQAGNQQWSVVKEKKNSSLHIFSSAPLDGIEAERQIDLDENFAVFGVIDKIRSTISIGRPFNIVQHATIGPPFLSKSTIIDTNADRGFIQHLSYPNPHKYEYIWPEGQIDSAGTKVDLRKSSTEVSYVSSHLFTDNIGWVTAFNAEYRLLIGYIWKTTDYPWLNVWHEMKDGIPYAKGLEFGTTGVGRPYEDLLAVDTRFYGTNSFFFFDALDFFKKAFICFQVQIPPDYGGVESIKIDKDRIVLSEKRNSKPRYISIETKLMSEILDIE